MRILLLVTLLGSMVGCFNPGPPVYKCDPSNPCPEGLACVAGLCASPQASDGAVSTPDMMPDLKSTTGCKKGNGTLLNAAWACPGSFSPAQPASSLCGAGWALCTSAAQVDLSACAKLTSFFVGAVLGKASGGSYVCTGSDATFPERTAYGCGSRQGVQTFLACNGFDKAVVKGDASWSSPNLATSTDQTSDTASTDGALCCPL